MSEPKVIYLGPACEASTGDGRTWAEDNPWPDCECGHRPVQYVLGADFERVTAERDALHLSLNAADQRIDELEAELGPTFDEVRAENKAVADSLEPGTGRCTFDVLWKSGGSAVDATITEEQYSEILKILNRDVAILSTAFRGAVSK